MGNTLNPIISLADKYVYSVPMILLIGWRGEPGTGDHPQHQTQGEVTPKILELLDIPYVIAEDDDAKLEEQTRWAVREARAGRKPVAIIGRKGVFAGAKKANKTDSKYPMSREENNRGCAGYSRKRILFILQLPEEQHGKYIFSESVEEKAMSMTS